MPSPAQDRRVIRFGVFELDTHSGELRKSGLKTRLPPQSFQVLLMLLEAHGDMVTREALRQRLWSADTFVDFDTGLASAVKKLRECLGDSAENPRFIETLPRRGYRFIASVDAVPSVDAAPPMGAMPPGSTAAAEEEAPPPAAVGPAPRRRRWMWTAAAGAAIVIVVAAAVLLREGGVYARRRGAAPGEIKSIAVLPLANLSGDGGQDYLAAGMTEALITELAQVRSLHVVSRTSVMQYQGSAKPVGAIARELGVDAVVEGGVVRSGQRVRITAQLIHAPTDRHLWARSYDREMRDVLGLEAEVAAAIAQAVAVQIRPDERRLARTVDPEVYEAYLRGRFYWTSRETRELFKAADQFQHAIDKDPGYAPAYSGLSDTYRLFDLHGLMRPDECMPKAEAAARKALALDDTLAEAHASLATVLFRYRWDWTTAEAEFLRALELDPSYAEAHRAYAIYLLARHRNDEALAQAEQARALSPLSPIINTELGFALMSAGRIDEAIEQLEKTRTRDPSYVRISPSLALAYGRKGDIARAIATLEQATRRARPVRRSPWLAYWYGMAGRRVEALEILREIEKHAREAYVSPQSIAVVHLGLGDKREAVAWLEKASQQRAIDWLGFATEMTFRLGDDPGFQALERRLGLPVAAGTAVAAIAPPFRHGARAGR